MTSGQSRPGSGSGSEQNMSWHLGSRDSSRMSTPQDGLSSASLAWLSGILNLDLILTKRMSPEVQESMQHRPKPDQMWASSKTGRIHTDMVYSNGNETGCSIMPQC